MDAFEKPLAEMKEVLIDLGYKDVTYDIYTHVVSAYSPDDLPYMILVNSLTDFYEWYEQYMTHYTSVETFRQIVKSLT